MKIGLLSYEYPPHTGFGGIGTYTYYQAHALQRLGHEVHVIAGWTAPHDVFSEPDGGVTVWRGRSRLRPAALVRIMNRLRLGWSRNRLETAVSMYAALRAVHARHRLDVVEMPECGAEGLLTNHLIGVPAVVRFHSPSRLIMAHYRTTAWDRRVCAALERVGMAGATAFTSCSAFLADEVRAKVGRRGWRIETIHNGIDLDLFDAAPKADFDLRARCGLPADCRVILFCGRLEPRKGIDLMAPVLSRVLTRPNTYAVIAGNDPDGYAATAVWPPLHDAGLADRVRLPGGLSQPQVRAALPQADVFFMPSQWEACPYACLEAMAASRPIVASDAGGLPELLRHEHNGLVVAATDIDGYALALHRLLDHADQADRFGRAARATVARDFDHLAQARLSVAVYQRCQP